MAFKPEDAVHSTFARPTNPQESQENRRSQLVFLNKSLDAIGIKIRETDDIVKLEKLGQRAGELQEKITRLQAQINSVDILS